MAVAALSTSALALTASPAPSPAPAPASATPQAAAPPQPFAKLVARAKPEEKTPREDKRSERLAKADTNKPVTTTDETSAKASDDSDTKDAPADKPTDLLAEMEAMVAAAGQLGTGQPVAVPVAVATVPKTVVATPVPAKADVAIKLAAASAPVVVATPVPPIVTDGAKPADVEPALPEETAPVDPTDAKPATPARGDIVKLLASLKSAFQPVDGKDAPVVVAEGAGSDTPTRLPGTDPTPAAEVPIAQAPAAPVTAQATTPEAVAIAVATVVAEAAPAPTPGTGKPAPRSTTRLAAVEARDSKTVSTAAADAPIVAAPKGKAEAPVVAAPRPDRAPVVADRTSTPADRPATTGTGSDATADKQAAVDTLAVAPAIDPAAAAQMGTPLPATSSDSSTVTAAGPNDGTVKAPSQADQSVTRHLDLARDNQWLDRLAHDISQAATQQGHLKFQLNPEHLGALTVEIANSASGTAIRMTADTDQARAIIADAQPRLLAEVRAQGLRISESHVDLNQQGSGGSSFAQGQQRQASENSKPFAPTQTVIRNDAADSAPSDDGELYA